MEWKNQVKQAFLDEIGFLKWAKIPIEDLQGIGVTDYKRVFISPDVNSLHILVELPPNDEDGGATLWHQIEDYPYDDDEKPSDWLAFYIGDSFHGPIKWTNDPFKVMSDYSDVTAETLKTITLKQLDEYYRRGKSSIALVEMLEFD